MVLLLANLANRGKNRGVQRLDRNGDHKGFYLGPGLYVFIGPSVSGVGDRPLDFYLEDLEKDPVGKIFCIYSMILMVGVYIKKENWKESTKLLTA